MNIDDILKKDEFKSLDEYLDKEFISNTEDVMYKKMLEVFGTHEKARNYFYSKIVALGGKRPYDYCLEGKYEIIYNELGAIEHGFCG